MNGCGKSDSPIVPVKPSNKCCSALQCAERVDERGLTKGNQKNIGVRATLLTNPLL